MKTFLKFFNSLPFSGKPLITSLFLKMYYAKNWSARSRHYVALLCVLIVLIFGHSVQAWMGYYAFLYFNAPIVADCIFGLYAAINLTVCLVHFYFIIRSTKFILKKLYLKNTSKNDKVYSKKQYNTMIIATLSGQCLFMTLYFVYFIV